MHFEKKGENMYKIINEDNSLVTEYPSNVLYDLISEKEKECICIFKKEIEKLTEKEGLGKITVSLSPDGDIYLKAFEIKDTNGYTIHEFEIILDKIRDHMFEFCQKDPELKEFINFSFIISS